MAAYDRSDRSTILPYQLEPTSTVADSESESTNSDYSSDSDSSAAMLTENVVDVRAGNTDWCTVAPRNTVTTIPDTARRVRVL